MALRAHKISLIGGLFFIGLTLATGISIYIVMLQQPKLFSWLQSLAQNNISTIEKNIHKTVVNIQNREIPTILLQNLQKFNYELGNTLTTDELDKHLYSQVQKDNFLGIAIYNLEGNVIARVGQFSEDYNAVIPIKSEKYQNFLVWDEKFLLRTRADVYDAKGNSIGSILIEKNIQEITDVFFSTRKIGKTGQLLLCAPFTNQEEIACFISSSINDSFTVEFKHLQRVVNGEALPIDYALNKINGIALGMRDFRNVPIVGAYGPLSMFDLGLVLKLDEKELYEPINNQLVPVAMSILFLILLGIILLYWLISPLVQKLVKSEQEVKKRFAENNCLYMIRKSLLLPLSIEEVCQQITNQLTGAMQFPNSTAVKINIKKKEFVSNNYNNGLSLGLQAKILVKEKNVGYLNLYGIKNIAFLPEEQSLIKLIAEDLGRWLELIDAEQSIIHFATHDELTGLPNRRLLHDRITQILAQCARNNSQTAVLFIDLDNFKNINDLHGHGTGDLLLKEVASRLKFCIRAEDTVARQGGDEFIVLLHDIANVKSASYVSQKILNILISPFNINGKEMYIGCSIGIALYPNDGVNADELLKNSDIAMYHAKELGRNNYQFFTQSMNERIAERVLLENELHKAIRRDELQLYFQPVISMPGEKIISLEALLRWNHPRLGFLLPLKFIPLAEETGLIVQIGEWVLRSVCLQIKLWREHGYSVPRVAINLSIRQIQHKTLVSDVSRILIETGVSAEDLSIEITESMLAQNVDEVRQILDNLSSLGFQISLDDFGTGYSNLSYLKRFPIDTIKIDRSFVKDIVTDSNDAAITTAIIAMAQSLNMAVIAEGLENDAQLNFLKKQGCNAYQGFYFSKPLSSIEISNNLQPVVS